MAVFSILSSRSYRLQPPELTGLDGTTYELKMDMHGTSLSLTWWEELPRPWRHLRRAIEMLERMETEAKRHYLCKIVKKTV
jgi:hypothetical protein